MKPSVNLRLSRKSLHKIMKASSGLLPVFVYVALAETQRRETFRATEETSGANGEEGDRKTFCSHPPTQLGHGRSTSIRIFRVLALAGKTRIGRFRNCGAITTNTLNSAASTGSRHSSQLEPVQHLPLAPTPCGHQDSSLSKFEGSPLRARRSALFSPHGRTVFSLVIYSARNLDCRNRRMRFQQRDYDNGRSLEKPNFHITSKLKFQSTHIK